MSDERHAKSFNSHGKVISIGSMKTQMWSSQEEPYRKLLVEFFVDDEWRAWPTEKYISTNFYKKNYFFTHRELYLDIFEVEPTRSTHRWQRKFIIPLFPRHLISCWMKIKFLTFTIASTFEHAHVLILEHLMLANDIFVSIAGFLWATFELWHDVVFVNIWAMRWCCLDLLIISFSFIDHFDKNLKLF